MIPEAQRGLFSHSTIDLIRNPILSWVSSRIEIHLLLATFKNQSLLTLNFRGESHDKGFSEDADVRATEGVCPLEACFVLKRKGGENEDKNYN
jgi:hypothetical protein